MISLDDVFKWNKIESSDELLNDDCEMLKSMYNSEPVINLFSLFDNDFNLKESRAFLDLYSTCYDIPINLISEYFLDCHIQYIYLVHIDSNKYYIFMYNYDFSPVMSSRKKLYCYSYITEINENEWIRNLMRLKIYGFNELVSFTLNQDIFDSFRNTLYFCTAQVASEYPALNILYEKIKNDAHIPLLDLYNHEVYFKK